jgi:hypothetical protein
LANVYAITTSASPIPVAVFSSAKRAFEWASDWAFDAESFVAMRQEAIEASEDMEDGAIADFKLYGSDLTAWDMGKVKAAFRGKPGTSIVMADNTGAVTFGLTYMQTL